MTKIKLKEKNKRTYDICWKCREKNPCILNCPHEWDIESGVHYISKEGGPK